MEGAEAGSIGMVDPARVILRFPGMFSVLILGPLAKKFQLSSRFRDLRYFSGI